MRTFLVHSLLIAGMFFAAFSVQAQSSQKQPFVSLYLANDTRFFKFEEENVLVDLTDDATHRALWGIHGGAYVHLFEGVDAVLEVGSSSVTVSVPDAGDTDMRNSILSFMGGVKLQNSNAPFYINMLAGMERHKYTFVDYESIDFPTFDGFAIDASFNVTPLSRKRGGPVISLGVRRVFDDDVQHMDIYFRLAVRYHLLFRK